jgi:hypothetical protein
MNRLVSDQDRAVWGDDLLSVIDRTARQGLGPELQRLAAANEQLRQRVTRDGARTIYEILDAELGSNWREINTSPEFLNWLALPDIFSGQSRAGLLRSWFDAGDAPRVLAFFRGFISERGADRHVDRPRRQEPAFVTQHDIDRHFERARRGEYANDAAKDAAEAKIHAAVNAGRFRRVY